MKGGRLVSIGVSERWRRTYREDLEQAVDVPLHGEAFPALLNAVRG